MFHESARSWTSFFGHVAPFVHRALHADAGHRQRTTLWRAWITRLTTIGTRVPRAMGPRTGGGGARRPTGRSRGAFSLSRLDKGHGAWALRAASQRRPGSAPPTRRRSIVGSMLMRRLVPHRAGDLMDPLVAGDLSSGGAMFGLPSTCCMGGPPSRKYIRTSGCGRRSGSLRGHRAPTPLSVRIGENVRIPAEGTTTCEPVAAQVEGRPEYDVVVAYAYTLTVCCTGRRLLGRPGSVWARPCMGAGGHGAVSRALILRKRHERRQEASDSERSVDVGRPRCLRRPLGGPHAGARQRRGWVPLLPACAGGGACAACSGRGLLVRRDIRPGSERYAETLAEAPALGGPTTPLRAHSRSAACRGRLRRVGRARRRAGPFGPHGTVG